MRFRVFDTESDDLALNATKIHIMVWTEDCKNFHDTGSYDQMKKWFAEPDIIWVCHNAVTHDMPLANRILKTQLEYGQFWDTLALSWVLFPKRVRHGLEHLGKEHGVVKPKVEDWKDVTYDQMLHRCTEDVKINWLEFLKQKKILEELYNE